MTSVNRVDQAVLLLRERLARLGTKGASASSVQAGKAASRRADALVSLRQLVQQGRIGEDELRKAFVRTLLGASLGEELTDSLEFQSIADQVLGILESNEEGRAIIARALAELE